MTGTEGQSVASDEPKQDFPDCAFCAPCRCDDECGCTGAGCWACGHRYDDVSGAVFAVSGQVVSAKPASSLKDAIRILKESTHETATGDIWLDYKALEALQILEAQPAAERTALKELRVKIEALPTEWFCDGEDTVPKGSISRAKVLSEIDAQERAGAKTE